MKKLIILQVIMTIVTLVAFFIILHVTGDKEKAIAAYATICIIAFVAAVVAAITGATFSAAAVLGGAAMSTAFGVVPAAVSGDVAVSSTIIAMGIAVTFLAAVIAQDLKISKEKAITAYLVQLTVIIATTLIC